jgi:hypothetical protein
MRWPGGSTNFLVVPTKLYTSHDVYEWMSPSAGGRSVPRVFIDQKFIGGGDDTEALDRQGQLVRMLQAAGVV